MPFTQLQGLHDAHLRLASAFPYKAVDVVQVDTLLAVIRPVALLEPEGDRDQVEAAMHFDSPLVLCMR